KRYAPWPNGPGSTPGGSPTCSSRNGITGAVRSTSTFGSPTLPGPRNSARLFAGSACPSRTPRGLDDASLGTATDRPGFDGGRLRNRGPAAGRADRIRDQGAAGRGEVL